MNERLNQTFFSSSKRGLVIALLAAFTLGSTHPAFSNSAGAYGASQCLQHAASPAEPAKVVLETLKACKAVEAQLKRYKEFFDGGPEGEGMKKRADALLLEIRNATQAYHDKAKGKGFVIDQATARVPAEELLKRMLATRQKIVALDTELDKLSKAWQADHEKVGVAVAMLAIPYDKARRELEELEKRDGAFARAQDRENRRRTTWEGSRRIAVQNGQSTSVQDTELKEIDAGIKKLQDQHAHDVKRGPELKLGMQQLLGARSDLFKDASSFKNIYPDWNREKSKLRIGELQIQYVDPATPEKTRTVVGQTLESLFKDAPTKVKADGFTPVAAEGEAGVTEPGKKRAPPLQTELDNEMQAHCKGTQACAQYQAGLELERKRLAAEGTGPQLAAGRTLPEQVLSDARRRALADIPDSASFIMDEAKKRAVEEEIRGFMKKIETPYKDLFKGDIMGVTKPYDPETGIAGRLVPSFTVHPDQLDRVKGNLAQINAAAAALSPEAQRALGDMGFKPVMKVEDLAFSSAFSHHTSMTVDNSWNANMGNAIVGGGADVFSHKMYGFWADRLTGSNLVNTPLYDNGSYASVMNNLAQSHHWDFGGSERVNSFQNYLMDQRVWQLKGDVLNATNVSLYEPGLEQFRQVDLPRWMENIGGSGTETIPERQHHLEVAQERVREAARTLATGEFEPRNDIWGRPYTQEELRAAHVQKLADETEHLRDLGSNIVRSHAFLTGTLVGGDGTKAEELITLTTIKEGHLNDTSDWRWGERKDFWKEMALGTIGGPLGQEMVAQEAARKARDADLVANSIKTPELIAEAAAAGSNATMNKAMTGVAGLFTASGQTVVAGGIVKVLKGGVFEATAKGMLRRGGEVFVESGSHAGSVAPRVVENIAEATPRNLGHAGATTRVVDDVAEQSGRTVAASTRAVVKEGENVVAHTADNLAGRGTEQLAKDGSTVTRMSEQATREAAAAARGTDQVGADLARTGGRAVARETAEQGAKDAGHIGSTIATGAKDAAKPSGGILQRVGKFFGFSKNADEVVDAGRGSAKEAASDTSRVADAGVVPKERYKFIAERAKSEGSSTSARDSLRANLSRGVEEAEHLAGVAPAAPKISVAREGVKTAERNLASASKDATGASKMVDQVAAGAKKADEIAKQADQAGQAAARASKAIDEAENAEKLARQAVTEAQAAGHTGEKLQKATQALNKAGAATDEARTAARAAEDAAKAARASADAARLGHTAEDVARVVQKADNAAAAAKEAQAALEAAKETKRVARAAAKSLYESGKDMLEAAKETGKRWLIGGTHFDQAIKMLKPGGKLDRYLDHIANLSELKSLALQKPGLLLDLAKKEGLSPERYLKKLDRRIDYFEKKLHERYGFSKPYMGQFKHALLNGGFHAAELAEQKTLLTMKALMDSPVFATKAARYAKNIEQALERSMEKGNSRKAENFLLRWHVPDELAGRVRTALTAARDLDGLPKEAFAKVIPALARDLAAAAVMTRHAPFIGRTFFENMGRALRPDLLIAGGVQRYVANPITRAGRWIGSRGDWFMGVPKYAVKDFVTMRLEGNFAVAALRRGERLGNDLERTVRTFSAAENVAEGTAKVEKQGEKGAASTIKTSEAAGEAPEVAANSLKARVDELGGEIKGSVRSILESSNEPDVVRRQLQIETAMRELVEEHKIPLAEAEKLRRQVDGGRFLEGELEGLVDTHSAALAQSRFLSEKNVAPRVAAEERALARSLKGVNQAGAEKAALEDLRRAGLDAKTAARLVTAEKQEGWLSVSLKSVNEAGGERAALKELEKAGVDAETAARLVVAEKQEGGLAKILRGLNDSSAENAALKELEKAGVDAKTAKRLIAAEKQEGGLSASLKSVNEAGGEKAALKELEKAGVDAETAARLVAAEMQEGGLSKILKGIDDSNSGKAALKELEKAGVDAKTAARLVAAEKQEAGLARKMGETRKAAEAQVLKQDADAALSKNLWLNTKERAIWFLNGSVTVAKAMLFGTGGLLGKMGAKLANYFSFERYDTKRAYKMAGRGNDKFLNALGDKVGIDAAKKIVKLHGLTREPEEISNFLDLSIVGLVRASLAEPGRRRAMTTAVEQALIGAGKDPKIVREFVRAVESDVSSLKTMSGTFKEKDVATVYQVLESANRVRGYRALLGGGEKADEAADAAAAAKIVKAMDVSDELVAHAPALLIHAALSDPEKKAALTELVTKALIASGSDPEKVQNLVRLIERDVQVFQALEETSLKADLANLGGEKKMIRQLSGSALTEKVNEYTLNALKKVNRTEEYAVVLKGSSKGATASEMEAAAKVLDSISEEGVNHALRKTGRDYVEDMVSVKLNDQIRIKNELFYALKEQLLAEHGPLSEAELLHLVQRDLETFLPGQVLGALVTDEGKVTSLGEQVLKASADVAEVSFEGVMQNGKLQKQVEAGVGRTSKGKALFMAGENFGRIGRLMDEGTAMHEIVHMETARLERLIDQLSTNPEARQEMLAAMVRSGKFTGNDEALVHSHGAYAKYYTYDEVMAHLAGARKELELAEYFLKHGGAEARMRAGFGIVMAEKHIENASKFVAANLENLKSTEKALGGSAGLKAVKYDSVSGVTKVKVPHKDGGFFEYEAILPKGLKAEEAHAQVLEVVRLSVADSELQLEQGGKILKAQKEKLEATIAAGLPEQPKRVASQPDALTPRQEAIRLLERDPFEGPSLFEANRGVVHSIDEKGRIVMAVNRQEDGSYALANFNRLKHDAGMPEEISKGLSEGMRVKVGDKFYEASQPIPLKAGDIVEMHFYPRVDQAKGTRRETVLGRYKFDGESFTRDELHTPRILNRFDISRFANEPAFVDGVKNGTERWNPFRYKVKSSSFSELHTHLTGAIEADSLVALGLERNLRYPEKILRQMFGYTDDMPSPSTWKNPDKGVSLRDLSKEELNRMIARMQIFPDEIGTFDTILKTIYEFRRPFSESPEVYADLLHQSARELAASGTTFVQYAHSSQHYTPEFIAMLEREIPKIERETGVKVQMIMGILRTKPVEKILEDLETFRNAKSRHIVGFDFLGEESLSLSKMHNAEEHRVADAIATIRKEKPEAQIRFHAGESPEFPENVHLAVEMGANRIGHGTFGFMGAMADKTLEAIRAAKKEVPPRQVFVELQRSSNIALDYVREGKIVEAVDFFLRENKIPHGSYTDGHGIYTSTTRGEFSVSSNSGGTITQVKAMRRYEREVYSNSLAFELRQGAVEVADLRAKRQFLVEAEAAAEHISAIDSQIAKIEAELANSATKREVTELLLALSASRAPAGAAAKELDDFDVWYTKASARLLSANRQLAEEGPESLEKARALATQARNEISASPFFQGKLPEGRVAFSAVESAESTKLGGIMAQAAADVKAKGIRFQNGFEAKGATKIAFVDGTLDPLTWAHKEMVKTAKEKLQLGKDDVLMVMVTDHPGYKPHASYYDFRLRMAELGLGNDPDLPQVRFFDPSMQDQLAKMSYPEVIERMAAANPGATVHSISGSDVLNEPHFKKLKGENIRYLVVGRSGDSPEKVMELAKAKGLGEAEVKFTELNSKNPALANYSSTTIREAAKQGRLKEVLHMMPPEVAQYVESHQSILFRSLEEIAKSGVADEAAPAFSAANFANKGPRVSLSAVEDARGLGVMSSEATRAASAEVQRAVGFQQELRRKLADLRHDLLSGRTNNRAEYELERGRYPQFEPVTYGTSEEAKRLGLLRAEERERAVALTEAQVELKAAQTSGNSQREKAANRALATAEREHAAVMAQFAGELRAREAQLLAEPANPDRANALKAMLSRGMAGHEGQFPGANLSSVAQESAAGRQLQAVKQLEAVADAKALREAESQLPKAIQNNLAGGDSLKARQMAQDLMDAHAAAYTVKPELKPEAVAKFLQEKKGWSEASIGKCQRLGLCGPNLEARPAEQRLAALAPVVHEVLYERDVVKAGENSAKARSVAELPSHARGESFGYEARATKLAEQQKLLSEEAAKFQRLVQAAEKRADGAGIGSPVKKELEELRRSQKEVVAAREAVASRQAAMKAEEPALRAAAALTAAEKEIHNQAVSAVMAYLRTASDAELDKLGLKGVVSREAKKTGAENLAQFEQAKQLLAGRKDSGALMENVSLYVKANAGTYKELAAALARGGDAGAGLEKGLDRIGKLEGKVGRLEPEQARALLASEKVDVGHQALAEALGSTRTRGQSIYEENAARTRAAKQAETKAEAIVAGRKAEEAKEGSGRAPASLAKPGEEMAQDLKRALSQDEVEKVFREAVGGLNAEISESLIRSARELEPGLAEGAVRATAERLRGLSTQPEMLVSAKMAYEYAADAMKNLKIPNREKAREVATEIGIRRMLRESGFSEVEIKGTAEKPGLYAQTVLCWKL